MLFLRDRLWLQARLEPASTSPVTTSPDPPQPESPEFTQEAFILDEEDEVPDDALLGIDAALFVVGSCDVHIGTEKDASPSKSADFIYTDLRPDLRSTAATCTSAGD